MNKVTYPEGELSLAARIEAILFVAPLPVTINQLASVFELSNREIQNGLKQLDSFYENNNSDWHKFRYPRPPHVRSLSTGILFVCKYAPASRAIRRFRFSV